MVDVSAKKKTKRTAAAQAFIRMPADVIAMLPTNKKGRSAAGCQDCGIAGAKRTSDLIPLCHQIPLSHVAVDFETRQDGIRIVATATTTAETGVEMEALTAASVAALTIYDMTKALDKSLEIQDVYLPEKTGGKSGTYRRRSGR